MYKKKALVREEDVVRVATAREALPSLIDRVAKGGKPVKIGPYGRPAAVLMGIDEYEALRARAGAAAPVKWTDLGVEVVGDVDQMLEEARTERIAEWERSLERTARMLEQGPTPAPPKRRRKRPRK